MNRSIILLITVLCFCSCKQKDNSELLKPYSIDNAQLVKEGKMKKVINGKSISHGSFTNSKGEKITIESLKGKTVIIDFWATWCSPCIDAMPAFDKLASDFENNEKLAFIKLSVDEDKKGWEKYIKEKKHDENSHWIGRDADNPLFWLVYKKVDSDNEEIVLEALPNYTIVGSDGIIIEANAASPTNDKLLETINRIII